MNILQVIRKFWWITIIGISITVLFTTSMGIIAIAANMAWANMFLALLLGILAFVAIVTPEVTIITLLTGIVSGILPGVSIADEISDFSKAVRRALIFSAFLVSFVHIVGATWPWNGNWLLVIGVMAISLMLGFATLYYFPDTATVWLKRIAFTYGTIALIIFLLSAAFFPKSKVDEALQERENAQYQQEDTALATKIQNLPSRENMSDEDKAVLQKALEKSSRRKAEALVKSAVSDSVNVLTDPEHRTVIVILTMVGVLILVSLLKGGAQIPAIPRWLVVIVFLTILGSLAFSVVRDMAVDAWNRPELDATIKGVETTRSIHVTELLETIKLCDLVPNESYMFVRAYTDSQGDQGVSFETISKVTGKKERDLITGMVTSTPEELPYPGNGAQAFILLVEGVPSGRIVKTDESGCLIARFNTNFDKAVVPFNLGIVLRKHKI